MSAQGRPAGTGTSRWLYLGFFLLLAGVLGYGAWSQASGYIALSNRGLRAEAVVAGYEEARGRRSTTWYPIFQFATADGRKVEATSGVSADRGELPRGARVTVIYDPTDPANVRTAAAVAGGMGVTPWILGIFALLMLAGAGVFLLPARPPSSR